MRKILILVCTLQFLTIAMWAQAPATPVSPGEDTLKPYQKYPTLPAFNIMLMDSSTIFNTFNIPEGKPTAIVFFDPNCKHCKHSIGGLLKVMDSVKDVQFYFITPMHDMGALRSFYADYHMADFKNIQVTGRDYEFFFLSYYRVKSFPAVALYDAHKKLLKLLDGEFTASEIYHYAQ